MTNRKVVLCFMTLLFTGCAPDPELGPDAAAADDPESLAVSDDVVADVVDPADTGDPVIAAAPAAFVHPGILVNRDQLDFVKAKIQAGKQPWKRAYDKLKDSEYASLAWTPHPRAVVNCGPRSNPNEGCSDERRDAVAAYAHALLWYLDGDAAHAKKAIAILDAWSGKITKHTGHNAPLQTGWSGAVFPLAAELIRHTYGGWSASKRDRFAKVMKDVYLPTVRKGNAGANGNWELIMTEATIAIAVFLDDHASFDKAVATWRKRVPAYIYLTSDGPYPKAASSLHNTKAKIIKYWQGQTKFVDGLAQETCRDLGHTQWGIGAALATAETAYQQGVDLYAEESTRLRAGMEFHASYMLGADVPSWLCGGSVNTSSIPTWEIGYNHFHDRAGKSLPKSKKFITDKERKAGDLVNYFIAWETLTHAGVGDTGL